MIQSMTEAQRCEERFSPSARRIDFLVADNLRQDDILRSVKIRQQVVELINEPQCIPAQASPPVIIEARSFLAVNADRAVEPAFQQPDCLQQGRFAGP